MRYNRSLLVDMADDFSIVGEASNGTRAIKLTGELTPDLMMPEMDGVAELKEIKNLGPRSRITVLISSEDGERAFVWR